VALQETIGLMKEMDQTILAIMPPGKSLNFKSARGPGLEMIKYGS
jgi:hypothetical protein